MVWRKTYREVGVTYYADSMTFSLHVAGENANGDWELIYDVESLDSNELLGAFRSLLTSMRLQTEGGSAFR